MNFTNKNSITAVKITILLFCLFTVLPYAYGACIEGNCQNGRGAMTSDNGSKYVGEFKDGNINGQGTWTATNGSKYEGEFKDGSMNGQGTWTSADGERYAGEFKDDVFNGQGTWTWADGVSYEGSFVDGVPQQPYELILPDGTKHRGIIKVTVKIAGIADNSQAQSIGLQKGDIIIEYNKEAVLNEKMMVHLVSQTKPEENVSMIIRRQDKNIRLALQGGRIGIEILKDYAYSITDQAQKSVAVLPATIERQTEPDGKSVVAKLDIPAKAAFGKYYALVIGNNNYVSLPKLKTARNDAQLVSNILKSNYGFNVTLLLDARRSDILATFARFRVKLSSKDNLLIYYAGHGYLDKEGDEGYWLPVDATKDNEINWISNSSITTQLKAMEAKHVLIIADSCYSGKLGRDVHIVKRTPDYYSRISQKKARSVIASGGLEPVTDSDGKGNHSVFADAFIAALQENKDIIDTSELFNKIRRPVVLNADQTPEYADIRKAGHEGGEFVFIRNK
jgi:hypothetical protein